MEELLPNLSPLSNSLVLSESCFKSKCTFIEQEKWKYLLSLPYHLLSSSLSSSVLPLQAYRQCQIQSPSYSSKGIWTPSPSPSFPPLILAFHLKSLIVEKKKKKKNPKRRKKEMCTSVRTSFVRFLWSDLRLGC